MVSDLLIAVGTCFIAGVLTTLHPCPFTTSLASISYLTGWGGNTKRSYSIPLIFISGFVSAYLLLAVAISSGIYTIPGLSRDLQQYISVLLGPLLIIVGMFLADIVRINRLYRERMLNWITGKKWVGFQVFPFGMLIALSFCPATAAIFFGVLIPLAIKHNQNILFPVIYAIGASIPLIIISIAIIQGIRLSGNSWWQKRIPLIAGWILILTGIYITITRIYLPIITTSN